MQHNEINGSRPIFYTAGGPQDIDPGTVTEGFHNGDLGPGHYETVDTYGLPHEPALVPSHFSLSPEASSRHGLLRPPSPPLGILSPEQSEALRGRLRVSPGGGTPHTGRLGELIRLQQYADAVDQLRSERDALRQQNMDLWQTNCALVQANLNMRSESEWLRARLSTVPLPDDVITRVQQAQQIEIETGRAENAALARRVRRLEKTGARRTEG